jgi:hypothetical protein
VSIARRAHAVLLAAAVLVLGACGTVECKPCAATVWVDIVGAGTDPARVLHVCVDGAPSCHQARINPITESETSPNGPGRYFCGGATDHCQALGLMESWLAGFQGCGDRLGHRV